MINFDNRQKTKILKSICTPKNYSQIEKETGIKIDSIRGRLSELRRKGLAEKVDALTFKITESGLKYLNGETIEV